MSLEMYVRTRARMYAYMWIVTHVYVCIHVDRYLCVYAHIYGSLYMYMCAYVRVSHALKSTHVHQHTIPTRIDATNTRGGRGVCGGGRPCCGSTRTARELHTLAGKSEDFPSADVSGDESRDRGVTWIRASEPSGT